MASGTFEKDSPSLVTSSSSCFSSIAQWKYDVFLSFRGEDTRKNFTSHLYTALSQKGILTFRDDQELERGKSISEEILKAIEDSKFAIIIFSKNYASSTWCLDELLKIYECKKAGNQIVLPVFYDVDPLEVQEPTKEGTYGKAFIKHEQLFNIQKVLQWRDAMTEVANFSGWDIRDRVEAEFIQEFVEYILSKLRKMSYRFASSARDLVGMHSRMNDMVSLLGIGADDVRIIGISGMGGIGKTTIARVVYEELSSQFEGSSFLANVKEASEKYGLVTLQEQLLSDLTERSVRVWDTYSGTHEMRIRLRHKKVLVVLDDVDRLHQLESLSGMHGWFGSGSRIIITTRDAHLLTCHGADKVYSVKKLSHDEAFQLFCLKAFKNNHREKVYEKLSYHFVNYADGLPLAVSVLGSFLCGRSIGEWKSALNRLKEIPNKEIQNKLQISFDGLEETEKKIFLDIACFFNGKDKNYVMKVLESCGLHPDIGLRILVDKALISISETIIAPGVVWMHDLLQELGREMVRQESHQEPGKRSRLWLYEDVYHVFMDDTGTDQVEGIVLDSCEQEEEQINAKAFSKMKRLRLLKLQNLQFSGAFKFLSNELRYVEWDGYPLKSLPSTFQPDKLVELHFRYSSIEQLWQKIKPLKLLKVIDLSFSKNFIKTPDFRMVPHLQELNLEGCVKLSVLNQSVGVLKRLVSLNLKDCKNLLSLPNSLWNLKSLEILGLQGCSKLEKLTEKLEEHDEGSIATTNSPNPMVLTLPSFSVLSCLKELDLSYCNLMEGVINFHDIGCLSALEKLNLSGNDFVHIPPGSISRLSKLEELRFDNCRRLEWLQDLPRNLVNLWMDGCVSLEAFPNPFQKSTATPLVLNFANCSRLIETQGAFALMGSYLLFLLKNSFQGPFSHRYFSICLPGSEIPGWFNYLIMGPSLKLQLPPHWCSNKWVGFSICAVVECYKPWTDSNSFQCYFFARNTSGGNLAVGGYGESMSRVTSDQLWFNFIPRDFLERVNNLNSGDKWNECSHIEESFYSNTLRVKCWGFRIVYEADVEDLNRSLPYYSKLAKP